MSKLVKSELRKLFTIRAWWILLLAALAWTFFGITLAIGTAGSDGTPSRDTVAFQEYAFGMGEGAVMFAMVLGIVMVTTEYRHQTITSTFLIAPRRNLVIVAKLVSGLIVGLLFGVMVVALSAALVFPATLTSGGEIALGDSAILQTSGGVLVGMMLYSLLGAALGSLVRNQAAALVIGLVWAFILETMLVAIPALQDVGKWTPGAAVSALTHTDVDTGGLTFDLLPIWAAVLVLLGYAVAFVAVASVTTTRRDV